ncbi:hypothetical protein Ddye_028871 [Dipteronia dyeriana]|uniref:Uncharacterized protein n=1 Tax=Dipteronia dyeriana TaxID=168575 RepID=A0AAD9WK34_9ROSI|nr:hypothetical protein Ddye_028871 [Dipteronia dyeriana]
MLEFSVAMLFTYGHEATTDSYNWPDVVGCIGRMNLDGIARLCGALTLKEREKLIRRLDMGLKDHGKWKMACCMVGKVLPTPLIKHEVFIVEENLVGF